jgi:hypothetical protein
MVPLLRARKIQSAAMGVEKRHGECVRRNYPGFKVQNRSEFEFGSFPPLGWFCSGHRIARGLRPSQPQGIGGLGERVFIEDRVLNSAPREFRHLPAINHTGLFWRPWGLDLTHRCGRFAGATTLFLRSGSPFWTSSITPVRPRAAECRQEQEQWLRRDTSTRGLSRIRAVNCGLFVHSTKRPPTRG